MDSKLVIVGYYGFNNIGDEAVLYSMLRTLRSMRGDLKITVLSNEPEKTSKVYGVQAANRFRLKEVVKTISQGSLIILGGGSLFQDITSQKSLFYYSGIVLLAKLLRKKVFFYNQGVGPVTRNLSKRLLKWVFNKVDLITVRDAASKELLLEIGVAEPEILVKADAVLGIYAQEMERKQGLRYLEKNGLVLGEKDSPVIGISVRDWRDYQGYKKALAFVGDELVKKGYQVVFLPFHFPDDIAPSREIANLMKEQATVIRDQLGVVEMLGALSGLQLLIGMRLHSLIMASVMEIPVVGISYDPKVDAFMKLLGQPLAGRVETLDGELLMKEVWHILLKRDEVLEGLRESLSGMRMEARDTARLALEVAGTDQPFLSSKD
ncbi:MAG: polysaccharide pyruvyl transferase CsaB [Bacillota bacterium]